MHRLEWAEISDDGCFKSRRPMVWPTAEQGIGLVRNTPHVRRATNGTYVAWN